MPPPPGPALCAPTQLPQHGGLARNVQHGGCAPRVPTRYRNVPLLNASTVPARPASPQHQQPQQHTATCYPALTPPPRRCRDSRTAASTRAICLSLIQWRECSGFNPVVCKRRRRRPSFRNTLAPALCPPSPIRSFVGGALATVCAAPMHPRGPDCRPRPRALPRPACSACGRVVCRVRPWRAARV